MSTTMLRDPAPATVIQVVVGPEEDGAGQMLAGVHIGPSGFDPLAGYPPPEFDPAAHGFAPVSGGEPVYAGSIGGRIAGGGTVCLFCLELGVETGEGLGYATARWTGTRVPHLGAVARLVTGCYPFPPTGHALAGAQRAAAVQLAIWYFTNRAILDPTSPLAPLVAAIVSGVLAKGPLREPTTRRITPGTVLRYVPADPADPDPESAQQLIVAVSGV
jgi:hypothetical protein